jgi:hypothetical protein
LASLGLASCSFGPDSSFDLEPADSYSFVNLNKVGDTGILVEGLRIDVRCSVNHCRVVVAILRHAVRLTLRSVRAE